MFKMFVSMLFESKHMQAGVSAYPSSLSCTFCMFHLHIGLG